MTITVGALKYLLKGTNDGAIVCIDDCSHVKFIGWFEDVGGVVCKPKDAEVIILSSGVKEQEKK